MKSGCWNIQGLNIKYYEVFVSIKESTVDVAVLCETKKKRNIHFYSGINKEKRLRAGMSIAISTKFEKDIHSYEAISEKFMSFDLEAETFW